MYSLIWQRPYSQIKDFEARISDNLPELLEIAEDRRLLRRDYGVTWFVMETMTRRETFSGPNGTVEPKMVQPTPEPEAEGNEPY